MSAPSLMNRRSLLQRIACGGAAMLGARIAFATHTSPEDATWRLAARVVHAAGAASAPSEALVDGTVPELLIMIFTTTDLAAAQQLDTPQLQQLLARRIQEDYQKGAMVHSQGWWLARSEAAILQLGSLLAARGRQI